MNVLSGDIIVNNFDEIHQQTEAEFRLGSMSLTTSQLDAACKAITGREFSGSSLKHLARPNAALMSRLLKLHKTVGQIATTMPELLELPEAAWSLEPAVVAMTRLSRSLMSIWKRTPTRRFIWQKHVRLSALRNASSALPVKNILEWGLSGILPCGECTLCAVRS